MTALVQSRQPLHILSMSNQPKRRRSERLAAYDEQDGDFLFTRGSKKAKTVHPEPVPEDEVAPIPAPAPKKAGRPRKTKVAPAETIDEPEPAVPRRTSKRKSSQLAVHQDEPAPAAAPAAAPATRRTSRRRKLSSSPERPKENEKPAEDKNSKEVDKPKQATNGASEKPKRRQKAAALPPSPQRPPPPLPPPPAEVTPARATPAPADREAPGPANASGSKKIALPFSDTPIINRNKEMRRKTGGRRSSLGMRGRRASSLIESGHSAIPHREVDAAEFYKHIEAEGLSEPRRMKQLLTWCGERALSAKPPLGSENSNTILGARAIQDQLLKDFASKSEFSDWFTREDVPRPPAIEKPNPRNTEHEEKIAELEDRIKRLKLEKKTWLSLKQAPPEMPPLFAPAESSSGPQMPDMSFLDGEEAQILASLTDGAVSSVRLRSETQSRIQELQASLEFKVDHLADSIHKVEQRVHTAGREADRVLALSAARLREREEKEKAAAGTKDMPVIEVLRSLGRILPDGDGGI